MILIKLFWVFFKVGLFAFGGGYATLPLITNFVVNENQWISLRELTDVLTISQMTPGPIAINSATFVGMKIASVLGAVVATTGLVFPALLILLPLSKLIFSGKELKLLDYILKGIKPAVAALIFIAFIDLFESAVFNGKFNSTNINFIAVVSFVVGFVMYYKKVSIIKIIGVCATLGLIYQFVI